MLQNAHRTCRKKHPTFRNESIYSVTCGFFLRGTCSMLGGRP